MKEFVEGDIYWSILHSIETHAYSENPEPRKPWKGKIHFKSPGLIVLSSFCKETGIIDDDDNATAIVAQSECLFRTEYEANIAYVIEELQHLKLMIENIKNSFIHLEQFVNLKIKQP